jgi:hypothetical protein
VRIGEATPAMASVLIESAGVFLILTDRAAAEEAVELWLPSTTVPGRANAMRTSVSAEAAFIWNPILDGVFRVDVLLDAEPLIVGRNIDVQNFTLSLPSGRLVLQSATMSVAVLVLEPGKYSGVLYWDFWQESEHSGLPSVLDYPHGDGPDGRIVLRRALRRF